MELILNFSEYNEKYSFRLENYLKSYIDNDELSFLEKELEFYKNALKHVVIVPEIDLTIIHIEGMDIIGDLFEMTLLNSDPKTYNMEFINNTRLSFNKIIDYIKSRQLELLNSNIKVEITNENYCIDWTGSELELTELIEALICSGKIKNMGTKNEVYRRFKFFFNQKDFNQSDKVRELKNRKIDKTVFLNLLEQNLYNKLNNTN